MKEDEKGQNNEQEMENEVLTELSFEEALGRLEKIVQELEEGNLSLEESLQNFQEGIKLSQACREILAKAEYKVHYLLSNMDEESSSEEVEEDEGLVDEEGEEE